jgi:hypothetical protein
VTFDSYALSPRPRNARFRLSLFISTLITGLDGRSNFERNGGASAPLLQSPLAHFYDICAGTQSSQASSGYAAVPRDAPATIMPEKRSFSSFSLSAEADRIRTTAPIKVMAPVCRKD